MYSVRAESGYTMLPDTIFFILICALIISIVIKKIN